MSHGAACPPPKPGSQAVEDAVVTACVRTAEAMQAAGMPLVSVYLDAGGTLRCYAVRGYRQLFDGIEPGVGVIGTVWRTGRPVELERVTDHPAYRRAAVEVVAEVCVPVLLHGRPAGVLNAESTGDLPASTLPTLERLAAELARELDRLGGPPGLSAARQLLTHATVLAEADAVPEVAQAIVAAALATCGFSSAVLLLGTPPRAAAQAGPLGRRLAGLDPRSLALVEDWVTAGGSSRSADDPEGVVLTGQAALVEAGACGLLLVGVGIGRERLGSLLLADAEHVVVAPAVVESVELLAALAAANLRSARAADRLRRLAETDPLTGLGHRAGFELALQRALTGRADGARPVAVLALDLDGFKQINDTSGHAAGDAHLRSAAAAMAQALRRGDSLYRVGGDEFATVLEVSDEDECVAIAERVLASCAAATSGSVSIGVAVATPGETPSQLIERADAALYETKRRGRGAVTLGGAPQR